MNPADFAKDGYVILRGAAKQLPQFSALIAELEAYARSFIPGYRLNDGLHELPLDAATRSTLYRGLRYLPSLSALSGAPALCDLSKQLGLAFPAVMGSCNIRMDTPSSAAHLFPWHQDISYLLGSLNSLTYWVPLNAVNRERGTIELLPGSHRRGLWPCEVTNPKGKTSQLTRGDIEITEEPAGPFVTVEAEPGDIVAFSQFLLHRSLPSRTPCVRWTVQVRHSDFEEPVFREAGFPLGDLTTLDQTTYLQTHPQERTATHEHSTEKELDLA